MMYINYPWCGDCAFSASFVKECTDVSYVYKQRMGDSRYQTPSLRLQRLRFTARTGTIELTLPSFLAIKPFGYKPGSSKT